jgi:CBS domain containing-hemolysin-like protein
VTAAVVATFLLLLVTACLAAAETVVTRINVVRALRLVEEERRGAPALLWLTEHRASSLNVVLVLTVTARVALAALVAVAVWQRLGTAGAVVAAAAVVVLASLVLGEVTPRTVALRHLEATGLALAGSMRLLVRAFGPLAAAVVGLGRALVPRRHEVSGPYASDEELRQLDATEDADEELEPEERAMIRSIFELADTVVREIMTPRPDMTTVGRDASLAEVIEIALERGFSRLPVSDPDDPDVIVGVAYAKDLFSRIVEGAGERGWHDLVRAPTYVPETKRCDDLLRELQAERVHLALVVDEHGELVGLVTIEDILEEIVGEIVDEHDQEEPLVEPLDDGSLRVDARLGVDDLNELLGADLPEEGWDTVGGLVFGTLGRVPAAGDQVDLDQLSIVVERVQGRRVSKVVVTRRGRGTDGDGDHGEQRGARDGGAAGDDHPGPPHAEPPADRARGRERRGGGGPGTGGPAAAPRTGTTL